VLVTMDFVRHFESQDSSDYPELHETSIDEKKPQNNDTNQNIKIRTLLDPY